ncbi:DUF4364 family protein [Thermogymnomonas acidicola]|nr:DUF4364 family protein [Thermogymnomonas acidicola]
MARSLSTKKNRDRSEIIMDILRIAKEEQDGAKITRLIYKANLNYRIAKDILDDLIEKNLVEVVESEGHAYYRPTSKGLQVLELLEKYGIFGSKRNPF